MYCGACVTLHGLVTAVELNQEEATIMSIEEEKVVVKIYRTGKQVRISKNKVTTLQQEITQMSWGTPNSQRDFYDEWRITIDRMDRETFKHCGADIYKYLITKVRAVVDTKNRIGHSGWAFRAARDSDFVRGTVWADGTHSQELPIRYPTNENERWWPCVWLREPVNSTELLPFYCPAFAWSNARPWTVHPTRVRIIETPGPIIEELP